MGSRKIHCILMSPSPGEGDDMSNCTTNEGARIAKGAKETHLNT